MAYVHPILQIFKMCHDWVQAGFLYMRHIGILIVSLHIQWAQVDPGLGRLSHAEMLRDNIADAQGRPSCGNWAGGIVKQYSPLGMASPSLCSGLTGLVTWQNRPELPRVSVKHEGSALQGLGWSACVPKNSSLQTGQALHIFCMVSAPKSKRSKLCHYLKVQCPFPGCSC